MRLQIRTWNEEKQDYTNCFEQKYSNIIINNNNEKGTLILLD